MYRLFVAIDLPESIKSQLEWICVGVPGAKWVDAEQLHLTLRFIGEVDGTLFEDIASVLADISAKPFELTLQGVGHFPPRGNPRILWVGLKPSTNLTQLHHRIERELVKLGLPAEGRKFSAHITLARLKGTPISKIGQFLQNHSLFQSDSFCVDEFHLYSSTLSPKGANHCKEVSYPLNEKPLPEILRKMDLP